MKPSHCFYFVPSIALIALGSFLLTSLIFVLPAHATPGAPSGDLRGSHGHSHYALLFLEPSKRSAAEVAMSLVRQGFPQFKRVEKVGDSDGIEFSLKMVDGTEIQLRPPSLENLKTMSHGLTKDQEIKLQGSTRPVVIEISYPSTCIPGCIQDITSFMGELQIRVNSLLWDRDSAEIFNDAAWKKERIESWQGNLPDIARHVSIKFYDHNGPIRTVTKGMEKFALPDLSIATTSWSGQKPTAFFMSWLAQSFFEDEQLVKSGSADLDITKIRHTAVKENIESRLRSSSNGKAHITLAWGEKQSEDISTRILDLTLDGYEGATLLERQASLLQSTFGYEAGFINLAHSSEVEEASKRARKRLPDLHREFKFGLLPGDYIMVKVPFETPDGGREYLWVEVRKWLDDGSISGNLQKQPEKIPDLKIGQAVKVLERDVFDYLFQRASGAVEGDETKAFLDKNADDDE